MKNICYLLGQWSASLKKLSMYYYSLYLPKKEYQRAYDPIIGRVFQSLIDSINLLPALKELELNGQQKIAPVEKFSTKNCLPKWCQKSPNVCSVCTILKMYSVKEIMTRAKRALCIVPS